MARTPDPAADEPTQAKTGHLPGHNPGIPNAAPVGAPSDQGTARGRRREEAGVTRREPNTTGWVSLLMVLGLLALQVYSALNVRQIADGDTSLQSLLVFGSLILGLAAAVLALVGLGQRRRPHWPSWVGLSVGVYAFVIAVFSWIGGAMNTTGI